MLPALATSLQETTSKLLKRGLLHATQALHTVEASRCCQLSKPYHYRVPVLALAAAGTGSSKDPQDAADLQRPAKPDIRITVSSQEQEIEIGPRGGRYYINPNGRKIYLKQKQETAQTLPSSSSTSQAAAGAQGAGSRSTTVSTAAQEEAEAPDSTTGAATADAAAVPAPAAATEQRAAAQGGIVTKTTAASSPSYEEDKVEPPFASAYTDVSMKGAGGGPCIGIWIEGAYNSLTYENLTSMYKDVPNSNADVDHWKFFAVMVAVRLYVPYMIARKSDWRIYTDSGAAFAEFALGDLSTVYLSEVWPCLRKHNVNVSAAWVPGHLNGMANALSREQWDRVKAELPEWSAKTPKSRLR
jgi:hypothetical protein